MDKQSLFEKVKPMITKGLTAEEKVKLYDEWSITYDQTVNGLQCIAPEKCAEIASNYFTINREYIVVLDVGTGTGLAAEEVSHTQWLIMSTISKEDIVGLGVGTGTGQATGDMLKKGFQIMDGLDPSEGMLDEARKKGMFRNLYCCNITSEPIPTIKADSYDLITVVGSYNDGHIPYDAIKEMIRITKPGGVICIVNRRSPFQELPEYSEKFFTLCDQLEGEKKWKKEDISIFQGYMGKAEGISIVYRVTSNA